MNYKIVVESDLLELTRYINKNLLNTSKDIIKIDYSGYPNGWRHYEVIPFLDIGVYLVGQPCTDNPHYEAFSNGVIERRGRWYPDFEVYDEGGHWNIDIFQIESLGKLLTSLDRWMKDNLLWEGGKMIRKKRKYDK